jgi:hypothetical protein
LDFPATPGEWIKFNFHFHNFESLDATKGTHLLSPSFKYFDHERSLKLFLVGCKDDRDGSNSVFLHYLTKGNIKVSLITSESKRKM